MDRVTEAGLAARDAALARPAPELPAQPPLAEISAMLPALKARKVLDENR